MGDNIEKYYKMRPIKEYFESNQDENECIFFDIYNQPVLRHYGLVMINNKVYLDEEGDFFKVGAEKFIKGKSYGSVTVYPREITYFMLIPNREERARMINDSEYGKWV